MALSWKQWTLLLYSIAYIFLFADQNLLSPNLSAAAKDFGFTDVERDQKLGGDIAVAYFLVGAPASFIIGCLADSYRIRRNILFGIIVLLGEGCCMATYFTKTYSALYVTRALTGFSVGGALPILSSVLGDWYAPEEQSTVMGYVGLGTAIGIALGQVLSGMVGPHYGWRMPFLVIGLPAVVVGCLFLFTTIDPPRPSRHKIQDQNVKSQNQQDILVSIDHTNVYSDSDSPEKPDINTAQAVLASNSSNSQLTQRSPPRDNNLFSTILTLIKTPSVLIALFQGVPGCFTWGMINTYLNDYLHSDIGMTVREATLTVMIFVIGVLVGIMGGAYGGRKLYAIDVRFPSLLAGVMAMLGSVPLWMLINASPVRQSDGFTIGTWEYIWISLTAFLSGFCSGFIGPIIKALLQQVTLSDERGQAFAMFNTFDDFGRGLGPYFVAQLIASIGSRRKAFNVAVLGWALSGLLVFCSFCTIRRDQERLTRYSSDSNACHEKSVPVESDDHQIC